MNDYAFTPTFVRGDPGQRLTLVVQSRSGLLHNLSIPGQRVDTNLPPGGTTSVDVTIPQSGAVRFFCSFHAALGMNGELLAGDAAPQPAP